MLHNLRWGLGLALALSVVILLWWLNRPEPDHPAYLELYGNVDVRQVDLSFRVAGRLEAVSADEGDRVDPGDTIASLEREDFVDAVSLAEAELSAQQALLDALEAGSRPEEIGQAEAQLEQSRAALVFAEATLERQETLAERNIASHQLHDEAQMQVDLAVARLRAAEETLALLRQGPREEDKREARAHRDALLVSLQLARRRLEDASLTAPNQGIVLTRIREPGAVISAGEPIYTISLSEPIWVRTYLDEPDLGHIHPGMNVTVSTDSGGRYTGQIGFISPVAEFTPRSVQTRELRTSLVYRVRVVVSEADNGLRQGMPVTVHVDLAANDE